MRGEGQGSLTKTYRVDREEGMVGIVPVNLLRLNFLIKKKGELYDLVRLRLKSIQRKVPNFPMKARVMFGYLVRLTCLTLTTEKKGWSRSIDYRPSFWI